MRFRQIVSNKKYKEYLIKLCDIGNLDVLKDLVKNTKKLTVDYSIKKETYVNLVNFLEYNRLCELYEEEPKVYEEVIIFDEKHFNELVNRYQKGKESVEKINVEKVVEDFFKVIPNEKRKIEPERVRRITGYLTGDVKSWNNAKKAELKDRVKHTKREE